MKPLLAVTFVLLTAALGRGAPAEQTIMAAMNLSEQSSYRWISTVVDDAGIYEVEGKVQKDGCTWLRMPMIKAIARRLGRGTDPEIEAYFKGNLACVLRTDRGWKTLAELPRRHRDWNDEAEFRPLHRNRGGCWERIDLGSAPGTVGLRDPFAIEPLPALLAPPAAPARDDDARPYSNAQFGVSRPHDELAIIVSSFGCLAVNGDVVTGTLTDVGARLLLVRDGQDDITPLAAAGVFKLLIKDRVVVKYLVQLEGVIEVERKKIMVHQVSSTVVKDIGRTNFEVPYEAARKLPP